MNPETTQTADGVASRLSLSSSLSSLGVIRTFIRNVCKSSPLLDVDSEIFTKELAELELGTTEAVSNIMRHGFEGLPEGPLNLECNVKADGQFVLNLAHKGRYFQANASEPSAISFPQEGGMGLYLISRCVDSVNYVIRPDGTNEIQLKKNMTLNRKGNRNE